MTYQANIPTPDVKPKWTIEDVTMDVTEVIGENYPGIFDEGDNLVGFFRRDRAADPYDDMAYFRGLSAEATSGFFYYDRDWCVKVFGARFVWDLEEQAINKELADDGFMI